MLQALSAAAISFWVFLVVLASPDNHGRNLMPRDDPVPGANTSALPPGWPAGGGFCFEEGDPFLLGPAFDDPTGMTIESCVDFCDRQGNRIAGLVAGYQCSCGVIINPDTNFEDEGAPFCMTPCAGNAAESCGGDESIIIFTKDDGRCSLAREFTKLVSGPWRFVDWYNDTVGSRALPHNAVDLHPPLVRGNLTLEACFNACGAAGYLLAGVEYADECYCGNELENFSQPITPCNPDPDPMACKGDFSEVCGSPDTLYVYTLPGSDLVPEIPFDAF